MNHVVALGLLAAAAWGVWALFADLATRSLSPESTMVISYAASVPLALAYVLYRGQPLTGDPASMGYAVVAGIFAAVGAVSYYAALQSGATGVATTLAALYFVVAALLGWVVLGDSMELTDAAGIALAIVAVLLIAR